MLAHPQRSGLPPDGRCRLRGEGWDVWPHGERPMHPARRAAESGHNTEDLLAGPARQAVAGCQQPHQSVPARGVARNKLVHRGDRGRGGGELVTVGHIFQPAVEPGRVLPGRRSGEELADLHLRLDARSAPTKELDDPAGRAGTHHERRVGGIPTDRAHGDRAGRGDRCRVRGVARGVADKSSAAARQRPAGKHEIEQPPGNRGRGCGVVSCGVDHHNISGRLRRWIASSQLHVGKRYLGGRVSRQ